MMYKNKIFLFLLVIIGYSFTNVTTEDKTASDILKKVSKTYKSFKTMKATFKIKMKNKGDKNTSTESGTVWLKGKMFKVDMEGQEIYCDNKTIWTYLKDANEVQIANYDPKKSDISPSEIFTVYEKGFLYKFIGEGKKNGKVTENIELTPTDKKKPFFKVKLTIDKVAKKILDMTVLNKNGGESIYEIVNFTPNVAVTDAYFKFDKKQKPGVVEIDLR